MPGAYAHIAVVNAAQKDAESAELHDDTLANLGLNLKFLELGCVSPDYPYLSLKTGQRKWADAMHYTRNATLLRSGVAGVHALPADQKPKATAWLLGFAAHMTTDMTIHPVVERRVGPYKGNEGPHRRCEMHQDAYIFPKVMNVGDTGLSEHLATGIAACHAPGDADSIDPAVGRLWMAMLSSAYPAPSPPDPPLPDAWHRGFRTILATMANANHLFPFARHVSADLNLAYPREHEIDMSYIRQLRTPEGPMDYDALFDRARANVLTVWKKLDAALVQGRSAALDKWEDWDLDTGRALESKGLVFWREAA
jgi:hypothetical protein